MKLSVTARMTIAAMLLAAGPAAAERGFYVGGAYSSVSADYSTSGVAIPFAEGIPDPGPISLGDVDPLGASSWHILGGYRALDWLAVEADFSSFTGNRVTTGIVCVTIPCPALMRGEVSTRSLSALALYPRGRFDLFLRAGFTHWRARVDTLNYDDSNLASAGDSGTDASYGGGAQFHVERFAMRLEFQRLRFGVDEADLTMIGVTYAF